MADLDISGGKWDNLHTITGMRYACGFCGSDAGPSHGYNCYEAGVGGAGHICICPTCGCPTFFHERLHKQFPAPLGGKHVNHITDKLVEATFNEARKCMSISAFTATALLCRKILMNLAVANSAAEGLNFTEYIDFLEANNFIPPTPHAKAWVDAIRKKGNEATHKIPEIGKKDAERIMVFTTNLLRFIYEMSEMIAPAPQATGANP